MRRRRSRFPGEFEQLQQIIAETTVAGHWEFMPANYWRFCGEDGAILNWWPTTKTVDFQGPERARKSLEQCIRRVIESKLADLLRLADQRRP